MMAQENKHLKINMEYAWDIKMGKKNMDWTPTNE